MTTQVKYWTMFGVLVAICAGGFPQRCSGQDSAADEALKKLYRFETWEGRTKTNYANRITNWVPDFASIGATDVVARAWGRTEQGKMYSFNLVENPDVKLHLRVQECASVNDAHHAMIGYFRNSAAVQPFPVGADRGVNIGDRCYLGHTGQSSIVFARNNMLLILVVAKGDLSVVGMAERLDNQLREHRP